MFSHLFLALANWVLLSFIAKTYSLEEAGTYNLVLAVLNPIFLLGSFQFRNHYLSKPTSTGAELSNYVVARLSTYLPIILIGYVIAHLFGVLGEFFWGVLALKLVESLFELPFMAEHKSTKLLRAAVHHILKTFCVYLVLIFMLKMGNNTFESFAAASAVGIVYGVSYLFFVFKNQQVSWRPKLEEVLNLFKATFLLALSASLLSFNVSLSRFYLSEIYGKEATAIFSVSFAFYGLWQLFFNSYLNAMLPNFNKHKSAEKLLIPIGIAFSFSIGFWLLDEKIYTFLFGQAYIESSKLTLGLLVSIFLSFFSSYFFYARMSEQDYSSHFSINLISILINALLLYPMIKFSGIQGAYWAWAITLAIQCLLYALKSFRRVYA